MAIIRRAWDSDTEIMAAGFHLTGESDAPVTGVCPHCEAEIDSQEDVTLQGDSILCKRCGKPVFDRPTPSDEDDEDINQEEFEESFWGEDDPFEDGSHDYEMGD